MGPLLGLAVLAAVAVARIGYVLKRARRPTPPTTGTAGDPARTRHAPPGQRLIPPADR